MYICTGGAPDTLTDLPKLYKNGFKGCIFKFRVEMKKVGQLTLCTVHFTAHRALSVYMLL